MNRFRSGLRKGYESLKKQKAEAESKPVKDAGWTRFGIP